MLTTLSNFLIEIKFDSPGSVRTPFVVAMGYPKETIGKIADAVTKAYPLRRVGEPEDVAKAIAFIASNDASFVTGITLPIDGAGMYVNM